MPASLIRVATSHACLLSMSFFKCSLTQNPTQIRKVKLFQLKRRLGPLEPVQRPPKSLAITATEPEDYGKHSVKAETTTSSWLWISFFLIPYSDGWQILETFPLSPVKNQRKTHNCSMMRERWVGVASPAFPNQGRMPCVMNGLRLAELAVTRASHHFVLSRVKPQLDAKRSKR